MRTDKVLITGGAGFIGSHIAKRLISNNLRVFVVDDLSTGNLVNISPKADFIKLDITSSKLSKIIHQVKPDYIFHLAAQTSIGKSIKEPASDFKVNLLGTENLLEGLKRVKLKKIIFASSAAVYGEAKKIPINENDSKNPISTYGIAKLCSEYLLKINFAKFKTPYISLRFANVYGENQDPNLEGGVIAIFMDRIDNNQSVTIFGDGNQTRDFIYVADVVDACLKSIKLGITGEFNIGTQIETSINKLYDQITKIASKRVWRRYAKRPVLEVQKNALDFQKFKKLTGWVPRFELKEGLLRTFK